MLVLGTSSEPYLCAKKDERALLGFFQKHISLPLPDYASRKLLWQGLVRRHGAEAAYKFDWPTLSQISEGYTSGQIDLARFKYSLILSCCILEKMIVSDLARCLLYTSPSPRD